jgi:thiol-disulfide isomerase/thioredoxin
MTELTSQEIREKINNGDKFLLDFYAVWCGPCRVLSETLKEVEGITNIDIDNIALDGNRASSTLNDDSEVLLENTIRRCMMFVFRNSNQIGGSIQLFSLT